MFKKIEDSFPISNKTHNMIALLQLALDIILVSHIFACLWVYIGRIGMN